MTNHFFRSANIKIQVFLYCILALSLFMIVFSAVKIQTITKNQRLIAR